MYIFMESYVLKNYDPRHVVYELLSGQTAKDGSRFLKSSFHYPKTGKGKAGGTACYTEAGRGLTFAYKWQGK